MKQYWLIYDQEFGGDDPPANIKGGVQMFMAADDNDACEKARKFIAASGGRTAVALREPQFRDVPLN